MKYIIDTDAIANTTKTTTRKPINLDELQTQHTDWVGVMLDHADITINSGRLSEFGKDDEMSMVDEVLMPSTVSPTAAQLNSRKKTYNRKQRQDTMHKAKKRLDLYKGTVNPAYLDKHPETATIGRFKDHGPFTHGDSLYISGFDAKKGHIRNRRKVDDTAEQLAEYYQIRHEQAEEQAEQTRIKQENEERVAKAKAFFLTIVMQDEVNIRRCDSEIKASEEYIDGVRACIDRYKAHIAHLKPIIEGLEGKTSLTEEEFAELKSMLFDL